MSKQYTILDGKQYRYDLNLGWVRCFKAHPDNFKRVGE